MERILKDLKLLFLEDDLGALSLAVEEAVSAGVSPSAIVGVLCRPNEIALLTDLRAEFPESMFEQVPPEKVDVEDVAAQVGRIFRREKCHISILDIGLDGLTDRKNRLVSQARSDPTSNLSPLRLQAGVLVARQLYRDYGARQIIWLTNHANTIRINATEQVSRQVQDLKTGTAIFVFECPQTYMIEKANRMLGAVLRLIDKELFERLPKHKIEWAVPIDRLLLLQRLLVRDGGVRHGLESLSERDLRAVAEFEMIPLHDPPTPFGLWMRVCQQPKGNDLFGSLMDADLRSETRKELAKTLERWLEKNLWGLPISDLGTLIERVLEMNRSFASELFASPMYGPPMDMTNTWLVTRCSRHALGDIFGNLLRNAVNGRATDTRVVVHVGIVAAETSERFAVIVANRIESGDQLTENIRECRVQPRGLSVVQDAIEAMDRLSGGSPQQNWAFQFQLWQDGRCSSQHSNAFEHPPWRVGPAQAPDVQVAIANLLRTRLGASNEAWAVALLTGPCRRLEDLA